MVKRLFLLTMLLLAAVMPAANAVAQEHSTAAPAATGAEHETAAGGHEEHPSLLPDLESRQTYYSAVWVMIIFVILLVILYQTAWKNILTGLKKREERIRSDIAEAEATRARAEATLKEYNAQLATAEERVRQLIAGATADGEKLATNIRMKAQQEAEEIKERSVRDIEATKDAALKEIYAKTADLATSVAEKIIRKNLNAADQQDLVRQSLDQLQSSANRN